MRPPDEPFHATVAVPGDKSMSHRALIFAAMATGASEVSGLGPGADVAATGKVLAELGVEVDGGRIRSPGSRDGSRPRGRSIARTRGRRCD